MTERGAGQEALQLDYEALTGLHDEMQEPAGKTRAHWEPVVRSLQDLGAGELARRWELGRRLIHENGVTYNVYGDPRGMDRPWELDPIPLVLAQAEWEQLRAALAQRARLLDAILGDLYGPQRLLRDGLLPPALVFAHPTYLRPCHGLRLPQASWLQLYAADLARAPTGQWWVLADRTQAPSGAGYALENRIVVSRTLSEAFRESRVERLAGFFRRLRDTLHSLAPRQRDDPHIALLTPGPYNETYFEHAYLARYLGLTLVEGGDLTVRDRMLYLKTLGGLQRVDVLLRRVDDLFCDPLSLRSDSSLGVAGLVHAARAGNVAVANALGSGLVETPALLAFLPSLCRALLGEELALPSVATWWCGQSEALEYVESHVTELVIKPAFPSPRMEPVFGARLSKGEREALCARLRASPHAFVAQEQVALSTTPVWDGENVQPRHLVLRAFATSAGQGAWELMPGGLTRISTARDSLVVSMQRGGGSKDTWISCERPPAPITLLRAAGAPIELTRAGAELPSRVADNLFWLGRYVERAEGTARIAREVLVRVNDEGAEAAVALPALLEALSRHAGGAEPLRRDERALLTFLFEDESPRSLRTTLRMVHQLASSLRDQLSLDTWRVLSELRSQAPVHSAGAARQQLNGTMMRLAAWSGLSMESMTRSLGWRFADMGRRVERGAWTSILLGACLVQAHDDEAPRLEAMLQAAESAITYRRRYRGELQAAPALDLLLTDETNPRALAFQLVALEGHVAELPSARGHVERPPESRIALSALARVRLADVAELCRVEDGKRLRLEELLARTQGDLRALSDVLTRAYLSHAGESRRIERF
ncbi:MAG TPA: circularly permuted type 2 ATP-grasp protein [Myxococcota bacterium]|nr:circularly permuted type 2 ATP-grasp protein [Myxococcota bacterium]